MAYHKSQNLSINHSATPGTTGHNNRSQQVTTTGHNRSQQVTTTLPSTACIDCMSSITRGQIKTTHVLVPMAEHDGVTDGLGPLSASTVTMPCTMPCTMSCTQCCFCTYICTMVLQRMSSAERHACTHVDLVEIEAQQ